MSYVWHFLGSVLGSLSIWEKIGFLGQGLFTARFLVQWVASEKKRDSVVPVAFWWLSLLGGTVLLAYVIQRQDKVLIVGQAMGLVIYTRNLMLVERSRRKAAKRLRKKQAAAGPDLAGPHKPQRADSPERTVPWA